MENKKIFIITVNWNSYKDVALCLDSLRKINYSNIKIVIIDNGSTDESLELIIRDYPEAVILRHERNLGLCAANNTGLQYAIDHQADFCLILNNDTVLDPGILSEFIEVAHKRPDAGIFGAKIYYYSDPHRIWWAKPVWDEKKAGFNNIGSNELDNGKDYSNIVEIDYANGCALFVRADVVSKIGFMDERFFIYYEDIDWCTRAKKAGYKILFVPDAKVWHKVARQDSPVVVYFKARNQLLWAQKNGLAQNTHFWGRNVFKFLKLFLALDFNGKAAGSFRMARIRGLIDYALGHFGDCPKSLRNAHPQVDHIEA